MVLGGASRVIGDLHTNVYRHAVDRAVRSKEVRKWMSLIVKKAEKNGQMKTSMMTMTQMMTINSQKNF